MWPLLLLSMGVPISMLVYIRMSPHHWQFWIAVIVQGAVLSLLAILGGHIWAGTINDLLAMPAASLAQVLGLLVLMVWLKFNVLPSYLVFILTPLAIGRLQRVRERRLTG